MNSTLKIYDAVGAKGSEICFPINSEDFASINRAVNGVQKMANWQPISVHILHEDEKGRKLRRVDSPDSGAYPLIFRESVIEKMGALLLRYGELLPLECAEAKLWVYNATLVLDALNEAESEIKRFDDGKVYMINRAVFREESIGNADIFKLSVYKGPTYFSQRFVDLWTRSELTGLEFQQVNDVNLFHSILGLESVTPKRKS